MGGLGTRAAQAGTRPAGTAEQATRSYDFNQGWLFGGVYTFAALRYPLAFADLAGANAAAGSAAGAGLPELRIDGYVGRSWSPPCA